MEDDEVEEEELEIFGPIHEDDDDLFRGGSRGDIRVLNKKISTKKK